MIRLMLVDDHAMVREGLKSYLATEPDIEVVGEASDGSAAAKLAQQLAPDVILMDLMMPVADGIEGTKLCLAACPSARIIILTSMPDDDRVLPAIRSGALSYLLKDVSADDLVDAIRKAASGKPTLHPMAASRMLQELTAPARKQPGVDEISPREMEVLQLIARGRSNKEIGEALFIGERTVKTHVSHLLEKMQMQDRTQLAIYAVQNKLV
jgi:two-component system, NarL family, response regulator LiaR